jgi:hypothetical protein
MGPRVVDAVPVDAEVGGSLVRVVGIMVVEKVVTVVVEEITVTVAVEVAILVIAPVVVHVDVRVHVSVRLDAVEVQAEVKTTPWQAQHMSTAVKSESS